MKLGDKVKLHYERKPTFSDGEPEITDGEFTIIGISYGLPHCFGDSCWSTGFNSFEYGEYQSDRPDIVRLGSIYVPHPSYLDKHEVKDLNYDSKTVSWKIFNSQASTELSQQDTRSTKTPSKGKQEIAKEEL